MKIRSIPLALTFVGVVSTSASAAETAAVTAVIVTATRQPTRANELLADTDVIDREEIERSGATSLPELLARKPGIQSVTTGGPGADSSIFIRGTNSGHTLVLVDGMRFGSATTGKAALETLPLALIERVEIVRGPSSALYGADAIGGVIQIFTKRGEGAIQPQAFLGVGSQGTTRIDAGLSGAAGPISFSAQAGHYRSSGFDATGNPPDNDGFTQDYGSAQLALQLPAHGALSLSLLGSNGVNQFDAGIPGDTRLDKKAQVMSAVWRQPVGEGWTSTVQVGTATDDQASHDSGVDGVIRTRRRQIGWQNDIRVAAGTALLAAETLEEDVVVTGTALTSTYRKTDSLIAGWSGHWDAHRLQANARRDFNAQFGTQNTSLLAYGYQINDQWRAYVSTASAFKAPTFNDLFFPLTCFPPFGCFSGNPLLRPERARNREVGIARDTASQRLNFVYFDNRIRDLIVVGFTQPFNVGNARIRGASAEWDWHDGAWSAGGSLTLQRPRDEDTDQPLIRRPERQIVLNGQKTIGAWRLGLDWLVVGRAEDTDFNTGNRVDLGGYGLIGAFAHYSLARDWTLELRGDNLGNKHYLQALDFRTASTTVFVGMRYAPK